MALSSFSGRLIRPAPDYQIGKRIQQTQVTVDPLPSKQIVDGSVRSSKTYNFIRLKKHFGIRMPNVTAYDTRTQMATLIVMPSNNGPRTYRIIGKKDLGKHVRVRSDDQFNEASIIISALPFNSRIGVSTVGTDYNPTVITNPGSTRVRRWPRDWHGENMQ